MLKGGDRSGGRQPGAGGGRSGRKGGRTLVLLLRPGLPHALFCREQPGHNVTDPAKGSFLGCSPFTCACPSPMPDTCPDSEASVPAKSLHIRSESIVTMGELKVTLVKGRGPFLIFLANISRHPRESPREGMSFSRDLESLGIFCR